VRGATLDREKGKGGEGLQKRGGRGEPEFLPSSRKKKRRGFFQIFSSKRKRERKRAETASSSIRLMRE